MFIVWSNTSCWRLWWYHNLRRIVAGKQINKTFCPYLLICYQGYVYAFTINNGLHHDDEQWRPPIEVLTLHVRHQSASRVQRLSVAVATCNRLLWMTIETIQAVLFMKMFTSYNTIITLKSNIPFNNLNSRFRKHEWGIYVNYIIISF